MTRARKCFLLPREFSTHPWQFLLHRRGQPAPTGLTRDQLETYGVEFKTATEDAIARHAGLEPKTYRAGKLWQRKFVIPSVVALATLTIGLAYYGSRRIVRNLPPSE